MQKTQLCSSDYPTLLKNTFDPPETLHYIGDLQALNRTCIAVVGTRKNSEYGEYLTQKIISDFRGQDICVVSGLASGIDTIAHNAALKNGLQTAAVFGTGLGRIFPPQNRQLAKKCHLLMSEYEADTPGLKHHFPARNRIVSGLCQATVVIEAPEKSGALITARMALEQGREIFVVPGDIDRQNSKGILKLLQQGGAYPVQSGAEILQALQIQPQLFTSSDSDNQKCSPIQSKILATLGRIRFKEIDEIIQKSGLETPEVLENLALLEVSQIIESRDQRYRLKQIKQKDS